MSHSGKNTEGIGVGDLFSALSNERRRYCIKEIATNGPMTKRELSEALRDRLGGGDAKFRKAIYISLLQQHLPRLESVGVLRETERGFELTPVGDVAFEALRASEEAVSNAPPESDDKRVGSKIRELSPFSR